MLLFLIFLSACGGSNGEAPVDETQVPMPTTAPVQTVAECTAQSVEPVDYAQPGDWITGVTEDYAVTMIEYADFQ